MHQMFEHYQERLTRRRMSESSHRNHRRTAVLFGESGLDPLTAQDFEIEEWLIGLELAPKTKKLHHENLTAVYGYACMRGLLTRSPMESVRLPRVPDTEPRILSTAELVATRDACTTDQDWLLFHLFAYTGMRRGEVCALLWEDVRLAEQTITVRLGKGGKLRHVPIHPALAEVLAAVEVPPGREAVIANAYGKCLRPNSMFNRLARVNERSGVQCAFHDFRRTVASSLARNRVEERVIEEILGWAPRTVARRFYINIATEELQDAILKLYANDPLT
jgi:integrase